jgi:hypothetical protein
MADLPRVRCLVTYCYEEYHSVDKQLLQLTWAIPFAAAVVCLHAHVLLLCLQVLLENYLMLAAALENQNLGRMQDMLQ